MGLRDRAAKFGDRLVAYILDRIILAALSAVILVFTTNFEAFYGLDTVLSLLYFTYFFGSAKGQTLGMRSNGIRVFDFSGRGPIGYRRGALRYLGQILSEFTLGLRFLSIWMREADLGRLDRRHRRRAGFGRTPVGLK